MLQSRQSKQTILDVLMIQCNGADHGGGEGQASAPATEKPSSYSLHISQFTFRLTVLTRVFFLGGVITKIGD